MVSHIDRSYRTRIIGARELTRKEREAYENEIQKRKRVKYARSYEQGANLVLRSPDAEVVHFQTGYC